MVTSQKGDVARVLNLQAEQELNGLDGVVSAINIVSHENIARVWDFATTIEELHQVVELSMDVTADGNGGLNRLAVGFFNENFFDFLADESKIAFGQNLTILDSL